MPKSLREKMQLFNARMVHKYPNILDDENSTLFCKLCLCNINGSKIFNVHQHFRTMKHQAALQTSLGGMQTFDGTEGHRIFTASTSSDKLQLDSFNLDLCTTLLEANIPLETIENPAMQIFLQKYTKKPLPNQSILRSDFVPALYEKYIQKLQHKADNKHIWISITESCDTEHQLIANFVFGLMEENEKGKSYLLNMSRLQRANASSLAAFINNSLQMLWPDGILYNNVQLVVTEAINYMKTALQSLKVLYPNMIYINCLLQSYHKMVDCLRLHFSHVNLFIESYEKVFLMSPHRQYIMRSKYHYLNLPSIRASKATPGTWLTAAIYYHNNFTEINTLLDTVSEEEDTCIQQTKNLIKNFDIKTDLNEINQHFSTLCQSITELETRDLSLNESLLTIAKVRAAIKTNKRSEFIEKFDKIINDNVGLMELMELNSKNSIVIKQESYSNEECQWLHKFAPVVCADVQNLSYAKSLLENNKTFSLRNLKEEKYEISFYE